MGRGNKREGDEERGGIGQNAFRNGIFDRYRLEYVSKTPIKKENEKKCKIFNLVDI